MSDDANSAWNGLKHVWSSSLQNKLLCHWHLKRAVRKHCMACSIPSEYMDMDKNERTGKKKRIKKKRSIKQTKAEPKKKVEDQSKCIRVTGRTFGVPVWEFFNILVEETDECVFKTLLRTFRENLRRYKLVDLLSYFERKYFTPERIKQWATWYRLKMYECEWLLNNNMHVEAWHNLLKTCIMERKKNTRVDKLMRILRKTEIMMFAKWARTCLGLIEKADEAWLLMRGEKKDLTGLKCTDVGSEPLPDDGTQDDPLRSSRSLKKLILTSLASAQSLLSEKNLAPSRLRGILKQVRSVENALMNAGPEWQPRTSPKKVEPTQRSSLLRLVLTECILFLSSS